MNIITEFILHDIDNLQWHEPHECLVPLVTHGIAALHHLTPADITHSRPRSGHSVSNHFMSN